MGYVQAVSQIPANTHRPKRCLGDRPRIRIGVSMAIEKTYPIGKNRQSSAVFTRSPERVPGDGRSS